MKAVPHLIALFSSFALTANLRGADAPPIDRHALVTRHNPVLTQLDAGSPLSVGNGEFCFTADVTGLQTFPDAYSGNLSTPLCTMADWGWHSFPNPQNFSMETFTYKNYDSHGRMVGYADQNSSAASTYLRENPQKFNLGQIGFLLTKADGTPGQPTDLSDIRQTLDLWNGVLLSHFVFDGQSVDVQTVGTIRDDGISLHVESPLVASGHLAIPLRIPYASKGKNGSDWTRPAAHTTEFATPSFGNAAVFTRTLDIEHYNVVATWSPGGSMQKSAEHQFILSPQKGAGVFEFACSFSEQLPHIPPMPAFAESKTSVQTHWNTFWSTGGAIDLSLSKDPRWNELERRIVLSEYLTAIQSAGKNPPAETGLTMNSWYGRFNVEMYWWHDAHFALWGRASLLENSMGFYQTALPLAIAKAKRQGYEGARWPKISEPSGEDSPSGVGAFLIWQQPHPIYLAELIYRASPDKKATLEKYKNIIFASADFMASFAWWDEANQRYVLGPPLQSAQERFDKATMINPTYELTYWRFGLETAQQWRVRLGLPAMKNGMTFCKNFPNRSWWTANTPSTKAPPILTPIPNGMTIIRPSWTPSASSPARGLISPR